MSITGTQVLVDGTAVKLAESNGMPLEVHVHVSAGSLFVGASNVSSSTGYKMDNGTRETFTIPDGSSLWGIGNGSTATIYVLTAIL